MTTLLINILHLCVLLLAYFFRVNNGLQIFISNQREACQMPSAVCDGNFSSPFGTIFSALEYAKTKDLEESLEFVLTPNSQQTPYLILDSELGAGSTYFSPFSEFCGSAIKFATREENSDNKRAYISLRTERLILVTKAEFAMENLQIDGRDFSVLGYKQPCLQMPSGCCFENQMYFDKKNPCFSVRKTLAIEKVSNFQQKYFSFIHVQRGISLTANVILTNVTVIFFNPIKYYQAFLSFENAPSRTNLLFKNVKFEKFYFEAAPIAFSQASESVFLESVIITNASTLNYNPFLLENKLHAERLIYFENFINLMIKNIFIEAVWTKGYIFSITLCEFVLISKMSLSDSHGGFVDASENKYIVLENVQFMDIDFREEGIESFIHFIKDEQINLNWITLKTLDLAGLISPILLNDVKRLYALNFKISEAKSLKTGSFELINTYDIELSNCVFEKISVSVGGVISSLEKASSLVIANCNFTNIFGPKGAILSVGFGSSIVMIDMNQIYLTEVDCSNGFCFELEPDPDAKIGLNSINLKLIKGSQQIFRIANERIKLITAMVFSINELSIKDSNISLFHLNYRKLVSYFSGILVYNCTANRHILFEIFSSETTYFENVQVINCKNNDTLGIRYEVYYRLQFQLVNALFENITGDASFQFNQAFCILTGVRVKNTTGKSTAFFMYSVLASIFFTDLKISDLNMSTFSMFALGPHASYAFKDCVFTNIKQTVTGSFILIPRESDAVFYGCTFSNISGSGVYIIGIGSHVTVSIYNSKLTNIYLSGKGGLVLIVENNLVTFENCELKNIKGRYNGVISFFMGNSLVKIVKTKVGKARGNTGAAFFLTKKGTIKITDSFFLDIESSLNGGVIAALDFTSITVLNCLFRDIRSYFSGGIIYIDKGAAMGLGATIVLKNIQFSNVSCLQDGAIVSLKKIDFVQIENVKVFNTIATNAGVFFVARTSFLSFKNISLSDTYVLENAGGFWFEGVAVIMIQDLLTFNISSKYVGSLLVMKNSNLSISRATIIGSKGQNLVEVVGEIIMSFTLENFTVSKSDLKNLFDIINKHPSYMSLNFSSNGIKFLSNSLKNCFNIIDCYLVIKNAIFSNNLQLVSFNDLPLIIITGGSCNFTSLAFNKEGFKTIFLVNQTREINFESLVFIMDISTTQFLKAGFSNSFSISNSNLSVYGIKQHAITLFTFNYINQVDMKNLIFNGSSRENINIVMPRVIQSSNSSVKLERVIMIRLFLESFTLFDLSLEDSSSLIIRNIEILDLKSNLGVFRIQVKTMSRLLLENFNILNRNNNETCGFSIEIVHFKSKAPQLSMKNFNISNLYSNSSDISLSFSDFEHLVLLSNITISFKRTDLNYSRSCLIFENCLHVEAQFVKVSNIQGQRGLVVFSNLNTTAQVQIKDSEFRNCTSQQSGGAIYLNGQIDFMLLNSVLSNNSVSHKGGAIYFKNDVADQGSFAMEKVEISGNTANISSPAISYVSINPGILKNFEALEEKNNTIFNNTGGEPSAERELPPVSTQPIFYKISIFSPEKKENFTFFSEKGEDNMQLKLTPFSGQSYSIEIEFLDKFGQPNYDLSGLPIKCESNASEKYLKSLIFYNNEARIHLSKAHLPNFVLVSRRTFIVSEFVCEVHYGSAGTFELPQDSFSTFPIPFQVYPCVLGQVLRRDQCSTCQNSYSFEKNITSLSNCRPCPPKTNCSGANIIPHKGFWNFNTSSLKIFKCILPESCMGGLGAPCADGYKGRLCYSCSENRGKLLNNECVSCQDPGLIIFTVIRIIFLFVTLLILCHLTLNAKTKPILQYVLIMTRNLFDFFEVFTLVFSNYIEDIGLFYNIRVVVSLVSFYGNFNWIEDCFITNQDLSKEQFFFYKSLISLLIPIFLSLMAAFLSFKGQNLHKNLYSFIKSELFLKFVRIGFYSFIFQTANVFFSSLICDSFKTKGDDDRFLIESPDISCFSVDHLINLVIPISIITGGVILIIVKPNLRNFNKFSKESIRSYFFNRIYERLLFSAKILIIINNLNNKYEVKLTYLSFNIINLMIVLLICFLKGYNFIWLSAIILAYVMISVNSSILIHVNKQFQIRNILPLVFTIVALFILIFAAVFRLINMKKNIKNISKKSVSF